MQAVKLAIAGEFWDSQIYSGRLYLFGRDGTIQTLDWDRLIESWAIDESLTIALECAFKRSDYLYSADFTMFLHDPEIQQITRKKFEDLALRDLVPSRDALTEALVARQDSPFPFPHADSTMYRNKMYIGSDNGIFGASCLRRNKYPVTTRIKQEWDGPVFSLIASHRELAVAAGEEGLFEISLDPDPFFFVSRERPTIKRSCTLCSWNYYSIYGSSHTEGGFLADFEKLNSPGEEHKVRRLRSVITDEEIFNSRGFSWGGQDKIYQAVNGRLRATRYFPWETDRVLKDLQERENQFTDGEIIRAAAATFGVVLEYERSLVVITSDDQWHVIEGEPVNWRVFPRSKHYENQLHIIYEDRFEVLSFNQDYFEQQGKKVFGTLVMRNWLRSSHVYGNTSVTSPALPDYTGEL